MKQKTRPVTLHLQEAVGRKLERFLKTGHLESTNDVDEDSFVSSVLITVKG